MKRETIIRIFALWSVLGIVGVVTGRARAQVNEKPHHVEAGNRVTRANLGISYIVPAGYSDLKPAESPMVELEGPQTKSKTYLGTDTTAGVDTFSYVRTGILMPPLRPCPPMKYTEARAKAIVNAINKARVRDGNDNPLNYQNSAKIQVAGHDALAVLAESSVATTNDRALVRYIFIRHRGMLYAFQFQAVDAEFEAKAPAFENFMNNVKFLEPDVEPPAPVEKAESAPVNIQTIK